MWTFSSSFLQVLAIAAAIPDLGDNDFQLGIFDQRIIFGQDVKTEFEGIHHYSGERANYHGNLQYPAGIVLAGDVVELLEQSLNKRHFMHGKNRLADALFHLDSQIRQALEDNVADLLDAWRHQFR